MSTQAPEEQEVVGLGEAEGVRVAVPLLLPAKLSVAVADGVPEGEGVALAV